MNLIKQDKNIVSKNFRLFAVLAVTLTLVFGLIGCAKDADEIADDKGGVTAQMVIENPDAYMGKTVTVSGDVEEIHSPKAFNMDSGVSVGELLVVGREPFPNLADANDRAYVINDVATVTGVVKKFVTADIEKEIGWTLDPSISSAFDGKTVLVANSVGFKPGKDSAAMPTDVDKDKVAADNMNSAADMDKNADSKDMDRDADGGVISDVNVLMNEKNRMTLAGRKANLEGAEVNRIVGPHTFTIGSGDNELYVMLDDNAAREVGTQGKIDKGNKINLAGTIEKLDMKEIANTANDRFRKLTDTERNFMKNAKSVYLNASKASLVNK